jgi:hypothetical protein
MTLYGLWLLDGQEALPLENIQALINQGASLPIDKMFWRAYANNPDSRIQYRSTVIYRKAWKALRATSLQPSQL